jgi:hypothetical protein
MADECIMVVARGMVKTKEVRRCHNLFWKLWMLNV